MTVLPPSDAYACKEIANKSANKVITSCVLIQRMMTDIMTNESHLLPEKAKHDTSKGNSGEVILGIYHKSNGQGE